MSPFSWPVRIYWEDTDAGGVVYYANYLRYLERARTEWLRAQGVDQSRLAAEHGVLFMVLAVNVEYKAPARLDDRLLVTCEAVPDGRTTVIFQQRIYKEGRTEEGSTAGAERELLIEATVRVVCLDGRTMRPRRIAEYLP
ncbi:MAG: tol-pal system-associated acyl-CoA thioesterase [Sinobacteraceae bacterium]|nr:tol-pal system-associated acyl-CoA thioesterase [Nevskiaceae bacterium]